MDRAAAALKSLQIAPGPLYRAAQPGYPSNFSRDSFIYALLAGDQTALTAQIEFSAAHQGRAPDPVTGEEPGKIHHELPGVKFGEYSTQYNACDTTALFLIGIAQAAAQDQTAVVQQYWRQIEASVAYIRSHLRKNLFYEDAKPADAARFALNVTYWKDSFLNASDPLPHYPVCYALVHFQSAYALAAIGHTCDRPEWVKLGRAMASTGLRALWKTDHFITSLDGRNEIVDALSSDSLHILLYLDSETVDAQQARLIELYSRPLVTAAGYLTAISTQPNAYEYHTRYVWVFEQALLHAAATRHNLSEVQAVSARVMHHLGKGFPELLDPKSGFAPAGNHTQLWSVGAFRYFRATGPNGRKPALLLP